MALQINDVTPVRSYVATAGQTVFAIPFPFFADDNLVVQRNGVTVAPTAYTLAGAGDENGGTLTLHSGAAAGQEIVIYRALPLERLTDFPLSGPFQIESLNLELATLVAMVQQVDARVDRAALVDMGEDGLAIPDAAVRANKLLAFDADGNARVSDGTDVVIGGVEVEIAGDTHIRFRITGTDGVVRRATLPLEIADAQLMRRLVFGWDQDAAVDSARFASFVMLTSTTGLISYNERAAALNDGEYGMRLVAVPFTLNTDTASFSLGTRVAIDTPVNWALGQGACWGGQLLKLASGRILLTSMYLNSPDGTYTHADARYDFSVYYTDDNGATWSARQAVLTGVNAYTFFGIPDYQYPSSGFEAVPGVNHAHQLDSGRIVVTGWLRHAPLHYIGALYTDDPDGITGWTAGGVMAYPLSGYNEVSSALLADGTIRAFVRREDLDGRGVFDFTSAGAAVAYVGFNGDTAFQNAPSSVFASSSRLLLGGATTAGDNRAGYDFYSSTDEGDTFGTAVTRVFDRKQRIGYATLQRVGEGWGVVYEVTSAQATESFNSMASIGFAWFNDELLFQALPTPTLDSDTYDAATEYAAYEASVTGDGGTVQDAAACQAAIATAIAGNYYSRIGAAFSPRWGHKSITGGPAAKMYSIGPSAPSALGTGSTTSLVLDTTTYAYPVLQFPDSGALLTFTGALRKGDKSGFVMHDKAADTNGAFGLGVSWTDTVAHFAFAGGSFGVDGTNWLQGSPIYGTTSADVSHFLFDHEAHEAGHGIDGVDRQIGGYFPVYSAVDESIDFTIKAIGGVNRLMTEVWHLNGADLTYDMIRQCGADVGVRY